MTSIERPRGPVAALALSLALALLIVPGCGPSDPYERVAVEGTVTLDGEPLEAGTIMFIPLQEGAAAQAELADGRFQLARSEGLSPGPYRVEIYSFRETGRMVPSLDDPDQQMPERANVVPERYNLRSELKADIPAGEAPAPLEFALSSGRASK